MPRSPDPAAVPRTARALLVLPLVATVAVVVFVVALGFAFWLVHRPAPALRVARWCAERVMPRRWAEHAVGFLEGLLGGLDALTSPRRFALVVGWSVVLWLVSAASYWLAAIPLGGGGPASGAPLVQGLGAFRGAPPSSPGFLRPVRAGTAAPAAPSGVGPTPAGPRGEAPHPALDRRARRKARGEQLLHPCQHGRLALEPGMLQQEPRQLRAGGTRPTRRRRLRPHVGAVRGGPCAGTATTSGSRARGAARRPSASDRLGPSPDTA